MDSVHITWIIVSDFIEFLQSKCVLNQLISNSFLIGFQLILKMRGSKYNPFMSTVKLLGVVLISRFSAFFRSPMVKLCIFIQKEFEISTASGRFTRNMWIEWTYVGFEWFLAYYHQNKNIPLKALWSCRIASKCIPIRSRFLFFKFSRVNYDIVALIRLPGPVFFNSLNNLKFKSFVSPFAQFAT